MKQKTLARHALRLTMVTSSAMVAAVMLSASTANAQLADKRWQAYSGCWKPVEQAQVVGSQMASTLVCVVPVANSQSADIATISNDRVVHFERLTANGVPMQKSIDKCAGTQSSAWSDDGHRLYLRSDFSCTDNLNVKSSTLFAIQPDGNMRHVQGNSVGKSADARVTVFMPVEQSLAPDVVLADSATVRFVVQPNDFNNRMARVAAAEMISAEDIIDLNKNVDTQVAQAFVAEYPVAVEVNSKQMVALADAGVPGDLIDLMVARQYPERFQLRANAGPTTIANAPRPMNTDINRQAAMDCFNGFYGSMMNCYSMYGSPYGFNGFMPWGLRNSFYGYSPYGFGNAFNNGFGFGGFGGYYYGNSPVIVVTRPGSDDSRPAGRAVRGQGYTQDRSTTSQSPSPSSGARTSTGSSSGSSTGSSSGGVGGASSSGDGGGRTARPKGGPGGL